MAWNFSIPAFRDTQIGGHHDELGRGVSEWKQGQRAGVGWHGGHDGTELAVPARRLSQFAKILQIAGISY